MYIHDDIHNAEIRQTSRNGSEGDKIGKSGYLEGNGFIYFHHSVNFERGQGLSIQEVSGSGNLEASSTVNHPPGNS